MAVGVADSATKEENDACGDGRIAMNEPIYVSVTDSEGTVIDRFPVYHWAARLDDTMGDFESYGSMGSEVMLKQRVVNAVQRGYGE